MTARILVVDDDPKITAMLRRTLSYEGYQVELASDGRQGLLSAREYVPDLVILDLMLPEMDGLEVCRRLRAGSDIPILMLTARDEIPDRVAGFDVGADDYLIKPFALEELIVRIRALLRRYEGSVGGVLSFGDLRLDTSRRQAQRSTREIELTTKEYELLALFLRHPRQVLTRDVILDHVWGFEFSGDPNVLEVYVSYLRTKLEDGGEARVIHTIRGAGYVLREAG